jgi:hypothetical protein
MKEILILSKKFHFEFLAVYVHDRIIILLADQYHANVDTRIIN